MRQTSGSLRFGATPGGVSALPATPETVASYLAAHAVILKPSTLGRRVAAIRYAQLAGLELPTDAEGVKANHARDPAHIRGSSG